MILRFFQLSAVIFMAYVMVLHYGREAMGFVFQSLLA